MGEKGFTLLELVIVIVLIGALSLVALPRILENDIKEVAFYERAVASVRYAQRIAVNSGCPIRVRFSSTPGSISLWRRAGSNDDCGTGDFTQAIVNPTTGGPYLISPERGIAVPSHEITFDSEGNPTPDGITIVIGGRSVIIEAGSGYVE